MARSQAVALLAVLALLLVGLGAAVSEEDVSELQLLRKKSPDRVIQLTEDLLGRFLVNPSRPFTSIIFFSAQQVSESNPNLRLDDLRMEYGYAAKAFAAGPDADKIFCFEAALEQSQQPFALLQVNALPYVVRILPDKELSASGANELAKSDKMLPDTYGTRDYPWPAEAFIKYLGTTKGIRAAEVDRPSIYKSPMFPVLVLLAVLGAGFMVYKLWSTSLVRHSAIWAALALAVFWFSASGGMYNIIRGIPFFIRDRNGRLQFFMSARGGQGTDGFTMGTLYLAASLSLAFLTYLAPRIANNVARSVSSVLVACISGVSLYQIFILWTQKTGYKHVFYV